MLMLGKSGLLVSEIGIGCWAIGGPDWNLNMAMGWSGVSDGQSLAGLRQAFECGANFFDTADVYGHGRSERLVGRFLSEVSRQEVILSTKVGYFQGCAPHAYHPLHLRHQLEMSLQNLGTDYIDVYSLHNLQFGEHDEYFDGAIEMMHRFQEEGKIRWIGMRGPHVYSPFRGIQDTTKENKYERFLNIAPLVDPAVIQVRYNMISPTFDRPETDLFAWAQQRNIGVVINKPVGQGLLLDKYDPLNPPAFPPGDHRRQKQWFQTQGLALLRKRLTLLKERFGGTTADLVRVALQYCLARSSQAVAVVGFTTPQHVAMNLAIAHQELSDDDIRFIRATMAGINEEIGPFFAEEALDA